MDSIDRQETIKLLENSHLNMLDILSSISEKDFIYKTSTEVWSIAEIIEHVIKVEKGVIDTLIELSKESNDNLPDKSFDTQEVLRLSADRSLKSSAPKIFEPDGVFIDKNTAIEAFKVRRTATIKFVRKTHLDLREIFFPHPRIGLLNGENWMIFISGHCLKHIAQIQDLCKQFV